MMGKDFKNKRQMVLQFKDCPDEVLTISKAIKINMPKKGLWLDELEDGSFKLTWSDGLISDFTRLNNIEIKRTDEE